MWMASCVVRELECDGSAGQENEREGGLGAVEAVGPADDQPHLVVEAFVASVREVPVDRSVDPGAMFADSAPGLDELGDAAALGSRAPAVKQFSDGSGV